MVVTCLAKGGGGGADSPSSMAPTAARLSNDLPEGGGRVFLLEDEQDDPLDSELTKEHTIAVNVTVTDLSET